jgi:integrase
MSITITEREPGVFDVRVRPGRHRPPHYFRVRGTLLDAQTAAAKFARQSALRPLQPNATLGDWMRHMVAAAHDLAPASIAQYRKLIDRFIDPRRPLPLPANWWSIGEMRLRHITADDAGAFLVAAFDRMQISARTTRDCVKLIRHALRAAVDAGMLTVDPWLTVKLPRANRRPPATPGQQDLAKLSQYPIAHVRLLLMLAAYTGARRGELLALTWEQIDLRGGMLTIGASLDHQPGREPELKEPKTATGRRSIKLPAIALSELRLARLAANAAAVNAGRRIESVPVFANDDGSWWTPMAASQAALKALRTLGLPGSLHTLRHAHATLLLGGQGGVSPHVVSRRLGHSDVSTTLALYAHVIPADDSSAADAIDRILARGNKHAADA